MARNAGALPREERAEPSRAEIEQGRRQMFEVDEADLELETGFVSRESRPRLPHIADRSRRRAQRSVGRVARPGAPSSPLRGGPRVRILLPPAESLQTPGPAIAVFVRRRAEAASAPAPG
jgi:hypothetical protein